MTCLGASLASGSRYAVPPEAPGLPTDRRSTVVRLTRTAESFPR